MNVYFANGTNIVVGCDNEKDSYSSHTARMNGLFLPERW